jgi:hypothetical protein
MLNNPVQLQDYYNALNIYGEDLGVLKGKTVRKKPDHVQINLNEPECCKGQEKIMLLHWLGLTFLVTACRNIRFVTLNFST